MDAVVVQRLADQRRHALGVDDVGGQELLHLPGDLDDRSLAGPAGGLGGGELLGDLAQGVAAQLEHQQEVGLGRLHVVGHVELARPRHQLLADDPQLVDLRLEVGRVAAGRRAARQGLEERLARLVVGLLDQRADVAVVRAQRVELRAVQAAADPDDQEDDHHQDDARRHALADARRLGIGRGGHATAAAAGGAARTRSAGLAALFEEGHRFASW